MIALDMNAPPGADVMQRARNLFLAWMKTRPADTYQSSIMSTEAKRLIEAVASALQQYGDERAREAREAADRRQTEAQRIIEEGAALLLSSGRHKEATEIAREARAAAIEEAARWLAPNFPGQARDMVRALAAKPGSETMSADEKPNYRREASAAAMTRLDLTIDELFALGELAALGNNTATIQPCHSFAGLSAMKKCLALMEAHALAAGDHKISEKPRDFGKPIR